MKAICRNCRQHYDTEDTQDFTLEGFCSNACVLRKARRLGWRLRLGMTYRQFIREHGIKRHKVPPPPEGIELWGIIPLTMDRMRKMNEVQPFVGQIAVCPKNKKAIKWIEEWIPNPRASYNSKEAERTVLILSRDDFRFVEAVVKMPISKKPTKKKKKGKK